jgi:hypothetical protein
VARILVSFEVVNESEVLLLKPRLKELDHLYFSEKKAMGEKFQNLLGFMPTGRKSGGKTRSKNVAEMLVHMEAEGVSRLEEECVKMGAQVEGKNALFDFPRL